MSGPGDFRYRYTVTTVPGRWKPFYWAYSYVLGALLLLYLRLVNLTSRVAVEGEPPDENDCVFLASYHDRFMIYMAARPRHDGQVWMVLDSWYMKPMHLLARWCGVEELVYVGVDDGGRRAQGELIAKLISGRSTTFNPDGLTEYPGVPRKGILHMSMNSGLPIIPVTARASRVLRLKTWDRKMVPLPFSELRVRYGAAIQISQVNEETLRQVQLALRAPWCD